MRRAVLDSLALAVLAAVPALAVSSVEPGMRSVVAAVYLLVVGALALLALTRATRAAHASEPSPFEHALERDERRRERVPELARLEREVLLGTSTAFDFHYRLRPVLREIAARRLASARGIDLDGEPARAREALGDETWQLVRPDLEPPVDRLGPGLPLAEVRRVVDALARI